MLLERGLEARPQDANRDIIVAMNVVKHPRRRAFLSGALAGILPAGATGFLCGRQSKQSALRRESPATSARAADSFPHVSFAQQGEDLIVRSLLEPFKVRRPTYLDVGAHDPLLNNNTYLFYLAGGRGVLVEPNPLYVEKLRKERPEDRVLGIGIGISDVREADYYVVRGDGQLNTFSKAQADWMAKRRGPQIIERVMKIPLVNINEVIDQNFDRVPNVLSIDTEGLDLDILNSLDFARYRPNVICAETLDGETGLVQQSFIELLRSKDYSVRGATFINTIFLANELLRRP
jgi:FkbM family methyltransferase